jgi:hypothetical protein
VLDTTSRNRTERIGQNGLFFPESEYSSLPWNAELPECSSPKTAFVNLSFIMARACIFCGSRENLNREDLWPKWLVETVTQDRPSEIERIFGSDSTAHFYGGKWVKGRGVCEQCNGGWMSNLESKIKLILEPMIFDSSSVLDYVQQSAIAIWTLKTAMAFECIKGAASTPEQRMRFSIPPLIDSIYNLPSTMSAFVLGAVISSAIGVVAVSIRALDSEEAKAKRLELRRQKELRALT